MLGCAIFCRRRAQAPVSLWVPDGHRSSDGEQDEDVPERHRSTDGERGKVPRRQSERCLECGHVPGRVPCKTCQGWTCSARCYVAHRERCSGRPHPGHRSQAQARANYVNEIAHWSCSSDGSDEGFTCRHWPRDMAETPDDQVRRVTGRRACDPCPKCWAACEANHALYTCCSHGLKRPMDVHEWDSSHRHDGYPHGHRSVGTRSFCKAERERRNRVMARTVSTGR